MDSLDYKEIEFRGGIEIHQQINTRKLFCECAARVRKEEPHRTTVRKLHAVASELGEYDPAALHEVLRDRTFFYQSYNDSVCLVELDEEPPHPVNRRALEVVAQVSMLLNARLVGEIQVMRKTVIDGSNTAGFQRTMLVATDGCIRTNEGEVALQYFCLEEDAARIIETKDRNAKFRLDRLGIPLLEIVTGPSFISPRQGGEVADKLGHIIRSLNVKRGIGSIRQDVNVSTKYGTRIEIKGVQRHRMIPTIMAYEAQRQVSLFNIAEELRKRRNPVSTGELKENTRFVTDIFRATESDVIRETIETDGVVAAVGLPAFGTVLGRELCPNKRLGTEMKDHLLTLGIKSMMHSDESLEKYGLSENEVRKLSAELQCSGGGAFLVFAAKKETVHKALDKLYERIAACFDGVPKESRRALQDGNSQYMRPLPGEARMYPETDIPPVVITDKIREEIRQNLPEILESKLERFSNKYNIPMHDLRKIENHMDSFAYGVETLLLKPSLVFTVIGSYAVDVRRQTGIDFDVITLNRLLDELKKGSVLPEAAPEILAGLAAGKTFEVLVREFSGMHFDLTAEIQNAIENNNGILSNPKRHAILMGELMRTLRGRIDGKVIASALQKALGEYDG